MGRINDRKRTRHATVCWVRRVDGIVYFLSDQTLEVHGTKPPTSWRKPTFDEAMVLLTDEVLAVPGVVGHRKISERVSGRKRRKGAVKEHVSLEGMDDTMVARVVELVVQEVQRANWPYRPFRDVAVPSHLHGDPVEIIEQARDTAWAERQAR